MEITEELLEYVEKIKEKINDKEYMDLLNLISKKRKKEENFYKITYIYIENVKNIDEETYTINYIPNMYKREFFYPFTNEDIDDIIMDNSKIYEITKCSDFDIEEMYISHGEIKVNIQMRNYYILDIKKV